jgi:hypothetical protein
MLFLITSLTQRNLNLEVGDMMSTKKHHRDHDDTAERRFLDNPDINQTTELIQ